MVGFFVLEPKVFSLIKSDKTFFEKEPLQILSQKGQLKAYKHRKIWQCMDTVRDKEILEKLLKKKNNKILKKKLLVIGGTGFLGSHVCREAIKKKL